MAVLQGKKVAILAADGFEQGELLEPRRQLEAAGARVRVRFTPRKKLPGA